MSLKYQDKKATIPPTKYMDVSGALTMEALSKRLQAAESHTKELAESLSKLGYPTNQVAKQPATNSMMPLKDEQSEFRKQVAHSNYDEIVNRLCKSESTIQTLKQTLAQIQLDKSSVDQKHKAAQAQITSIKAACDSELKKLEREVASMQAKLCEVASQRDGIKQERDHLQQTLQEMLNTKFDMSSQLEGMAVYKKNIDRRIQDQREQLMRETDLRRSLEQSQQVLLQRVSDTETILEAERKQMSELLLGYQESQKQLQQATDLAESEREQKICLQQRLQEIMPDGENPFKSLEDQKSSLLTELRTVRSKYSQLSDEFDQMTLKVDEYQKTQIALEKDKQRLQNALSEATKKQADLIAEYESNIEALKLDAQYKQRSEEISQQMNAKLTQESRLKTQTEEKCSQLQYQLHDAKSQLAAKERQLDNMRQTLNTDKQHFEQRIESLQASSDSDIQQKEKMIRQLSETVSQLTTEKHNVETKLEENKLQVHSLETSQGNLTYENKRLHQRITVLEKATETQESLEANLKDLVQEKNNLAYEKGQLQTRVEQLQQQLQEMVSMQSELGQLQRTHQNLMLKYKKLELNLHECQCRAQRLESQLEQALEGIKEKDLQIKESKESQSQLQKEANLLRQELELGEQKEHQKSLGVKQQLAEAQEAENRVKGQLDEAMALQKQLQNQCTELQTQLGGKDEVIAQLRSDRQELHRNMTKTENELKTAKDEVSAVKDFEKTDVEPLKTMMEQYKADNSKMANTMDMLVLKNENLQATVKKLENQLEKKSQIIANLQQTREDEEKQHKAQLENFEERMINLKAQVSKDRDSSTKKNYKEVQDLRKKVEELLSRNGELSRSNSDFRKRVTDLELELKDRKEKLNKEKQRTEHLQKIRGKQDETIKGMESILEQIRDLEKSREFYIKKNKEQAQMIQTFLGQITSLQEEVRNLIQAQMDSSVLMQEQEETLLKERDAAIEWKLRYQEARKRQQELENLSRQAEEKIQEATDESLLMSDSLQDAHDWFRTKFDDLYQQLLNSRKSQQECEQENNDMKAMLTAERKRARQASKRADELVKVSNATMDRVASEAENIQKSSDDQLRELKKLLQLERENTKQAEQRLKDFQESSLRYTERLARELQQMKIAPFAQS